MKVEVTCPNCNFSKVILKEKIPMGVRWANCPRCKSRFEFNLSESAFDFEQEKRDLRPENHAEKKASPWERRSELGLWQGIYKTFKAVLFSPEDLFSTMTYKGGIREPLAFGLLLGSIGSMFGFFWQFLIMFGGLISLGHDLTGQFAWSLIFLIIIVISPLFVTITIFLTSSILHLLLLVVRGEKNGFEATFRVISYSQATQVLGLIPFIGGLIGSFWLLIIQIIGIREIHNTSYLRVIIAFFIPLALIFLSVMAVLISLFILR